MLRPLPTLPPLHNTTTLSHLFSTFSSSSRETVILFGHLWPLTLERHNHESSIRCFSNLPRVGSHSYMSFPLLHINFSESHTRTKEPVLRRHCAGLIPVNALDSMHLVLTKSNPIVCTLYVPTPRALRTHHKNRSMALPSCDWQLIPYPTIPPLTPCNSILR